MGRGTAEVVEEEEASANVEDDEEGRVDETGERVDEEAEDEDSEAEEEENDDDDEDTVGEEVLAVTTVVIGAGEVETS
jgi:hypothetical protein